MPKAIELPSDYPPAGVEVRLIQRFVKLEGRRILEIGCGDGRLTRHYAPLASTVVAIEPDPARIREARTAAVVFARGASGPTVVYRGRIDNRYVDLGRARPAPTVRDLDDVLDALGTGASIPFRSTA